MALLALHGVSRIYRARRRVNACRIAAVGV
jgi:hypothetical protein